MTSWRLLPALGLALLAGMPAATLAQWSASNLLQAQSGNIPFRAPSNRTAFYDQFRLDYSMAQLRGGIRYETYRNSQGGGNYGGTGGYGELTQRWAEWLGGGMKTRVGNFYTILGRGLLHRSFELSGVVLEDPGLRSQYGPSRDVDGVVVEAARGPLRARIFTGRPNGGDISPGFEDRGLPRYSSPLSGAELSAVGPRRIKAGLAYVRSPQGREVEYASAFVDGDLLRALGDSLVSLPIYVEFASGGGKSRWFDFATADSQPHALFASASLLTENFTLLAEWKDYGQFRFGTNDPPSLVKEHSEALLNRYTHVLDASGEQGYQLEATYSRDALGAALLNVSRADRNLVGRNERFEEHYLEIRTTPMNEGHPWEARVFGFRGRDEFDGLLKLRAGGGSASFQGPSSWSAGCDLEAATVTRRAGSISYYYRDQYFSLSLARAALGSLSAVWERTTDKAAAPPSKPGDPAFFARRYLGLYLRGHISARQDATLFYGERRGGRACTAGTCYDVLAFKGAEVRLSWHL